MFNRHRYSTTISLTWVDTQLAATQITSKVLKTLQVELPMRSIFEAPTVAGLAKLIETIGWTRQGQRLPIESKGEREQGTYDTS